LQRKGWVLEQVEKETNLIQLERDLVGPLTADRDFEKKNQFTEAEDRGKFRRTLGEKSNKVFSNLGKQGIQFPGGGLLHRDHP